MLSKKFSKIPLSLKAPFSNTCLNLVSYQELSRLSRSGLNLVLSLCLSVLLSFSFITFAQQHQEHSAELFPTTNGTEVQILSENFLTVVSTGQIVQDRLELHKALIPTQKVQILFSNAQTGEVGILPAIVNFQANDLLIPIAELSNNTIQSPTVSYQSLSHWLSTTKGITFKYP